MSAWRDGSWETGAWRLGSWRGMEAGTGLVLRYFGRISKARTPRISKMNYTVTPIGDGTYNRVQYSGISADKVNSISYEGWEEV